MIIKSKSRKIGNFDQLFDYMKKGADQHHGHHVFSKNVYARDREGILEEFQFNARLFPKRINSVYLYHEIISITRTEAMSLREQQAALHHIVNEYVEHRANNNLVWGYMHNDAKTNVHFHLMISSNPRGGTKNLRLSKKEFDTAKKHLETWTNTHYPALRQGIVINKESSKKTSHKGDELKKRTGKMPERERVSQALEHIFSTTKDKNAFFTQLQSEHLEIYTRGKQIGFVDTLTGRKYRLNTLGLSDKFESMSKQIELGNSHQKEVQPKAHKQPQAEPPARETTKIQTAKQELTKHRESKDQEPPEKSKKWIAQLIGQIKQQVLGLIVHYLKRWRNTKEISVSKQAMKSIQAKQELEALRHAQNAGASDKHYSLTSKYGNNADDF